MGLCGQHTGLCLGVDGLEVKGVGRMVQKWCLILRMKVILNGTLGEMGGAGV